MPIKTIIIMADTAAAPKAKKPAKKRAAPQHPPYESMISEAVKALDDKKGSSRQAIIKYIKNTHRLEQANVETRIKLALKRMAGKGVLTHTRGSGASGSFRVPADSSKAAKGKKKTTKKSTPKKVKKPPVSSKKAAKAKSPKTKKPAAKTESKKKPAAKKSKKPAAKKPKVSPKKASAKPKKAVAAKQKKGSPKKGKKGAKKGGKK